MTILMNQALISIFMSFPEAVLILLLGFALCDVKVEIKKILLIGWIQGIVTFMILIFNIRFGLHLLVIVTTHSFLVSVILNMKVYKAIVPVLIGTFILGIIQGLYYSLSIHFFNIDFIQLRTDFIFSFVYNLPAYILFALFLFIVKKMKISLL